MVNMMRRARAEIQADHLACVFDAKGKTFRDEMYPEYKANRSAMPEDLVAQIEPIHELVKALGWPVLMVSGVEADDVIGTLARQATEAGWDTIISTGDKDLAQLVNPSVSLINTMTDEKLDVAGVTQKFGVPPERIVDYLTIVGDAVDNVPGVPKAGPKTANKWLAEYGDLDQLMARADEIKGVVGDNLRASLPWLLRARELLTVKLDCDLNEHIPGLDDLHAKPENLPVLKEFFERFAFKTWLRDVEKRLSEAGATAVSAGTQGDTPAFDLVGNSVSSPSAVSSKSVNPPALTPTIPAKDATEQNAIERRYECVVDQKRLDAWLAKIAAADLV
jgi:DNA polymerase-1